MAALSWKHSLPSAPATMSIKPASLRARKAFASWASFWKSLMAHGYALDIAAPLLLGSAHAPSAPGLGTWVPKGQHVVSIK